MASNWIQLHEVAGHQNQKYVTEHGVIVVTESRITTAQIKSAPCQCPWLTTTITATPLRFVNSYFVLEALAIREWFLGTIAIREWVSRMQLFVMSFCCTLI